MLSQGAQWLYRGLRVGRAQGSEVELIPGTSLRDDPLSSCQVVKHDAPRNRAENGAERLTRLQESIGCVTG